MNTILELFAVTLCYIMGSVASVLDAVGDIVQVLKGKG